MFKKITQLFQGSKETPEQLYLQENQLKFDSERGPNTALCCKIGKYSRKATPTQSDYTNIKSILRFVFA